MHIYVADRGVYNVDTKQIRTSNARTEYYPYFLSGQNVTETSANVYRVEDSTFTTHDSPTADFHLRARTVRVYENDHVVFQNVTFYVGKVPIFWWPYMYQSLTDAFSFSIAPADLSSWGPSLLTQVAFPIGENIKGRVRLDYRGRRGPAPGDSGRGVVTDPVSEASGLAAVVGVGAVGVLLLQAPASSRAVRDATIQN